MRFGLFLDAFLSSRSAEIVNIHNRAGGSVTQDALKNNKTDGQSSAGLILDSICICLSAPFRRTAPPARRI